MDIVKHLGVAHNDPTWLEIVASMKISGFEMDVPTEILVGCIISGELTITNFVDIVASVLPGGSDSPMRTPSRSAYFEQDAEIDG